MPPRARGGSNRVSTLRLACKPCNVKKGTQTAAEFGHPEVQAQARMPLKAAAAVNASRWALWRRLAALGLPLETGTGGRTKQRRSRQKRHFGFMTGDIVRAVVPPGTKASGRHTGRIAVRAGGGCRVGTVDDIRWKHCRMLQRHDGYGYALAGALKT